jgi:hypothetical protein
MIFHYTAGHEEQIFNTRTYFQSLFAEPQTTYSEPNAEPSTIKTSSELRLDLLAVEIFIASAITAGLWVLAGWRRGNTSAASTRALRAGP